MLHPRSKPSRFSVVSIVCEPHFWSNQENLAIVKDDSTIVDDVLVHDGPIERRCGGMREFGGERSEKRRKVVRFLNFSDERRELSDSHSDVY